jgi:hypothetical protein
VEKPGRLTVRENTAESEVAEQARDKGEHAGEDRVDASEDLAEAGVDLGEEGGLGSSAETQEM